MFFLFNPAMMKQGLFGNLFKFVQADMQMFVIILLCWESAFLVFGTAVVLFESPVSVAPDYLTTMLWLLLTRLFETILGTEPTEGLKQRSSPGIIVQIKRQRNLFLWIQNRINNKVHDRRTLRNRGARG